MSKIKRLSHIENFTLIELLVVIAIIAILFSLLMPALYTAKQSAKTVVCAAQEKQMGLAMSQYIANNNGSFPFTVAKTGHGWRTVFPFFNDADYIKNCSLSPYLDVSQLIWECPSDPYREKFDFAMYAYNGQYLGGGMSSAGVNNTMGLPLRVARLKTASGTVLGLDSPATLTRCGGPGWDVEHWGVDKYYYGFKIPVAGEYNTWALYAGKAIKGAGGVWRHNGRQKGINIFFCDGHVKSYYPTTAGEVVNDNRMWTSQGKVLPIKTDITGDAKDTQWGRLNPKWPGGI